ncbi:MAG: S8 family peptidase, partial [Chitinophagaceae bacterium]|nr:S8 family peptidase [Chitinophagaceae bacterium]
KSVLAPFLAITSTHINDVSGFSQQAYAVKGPMLPGMVLRRRLSAELNIVVCDSPDSEKKWQKSAALLAPLNNKWKLSAGLLQQPANEKQADLKQFLLQVADIDAFLQQCRRNPEITILSTDKNTGAVQLKTRAAWIDTAMNDPLVLFIAEARRPLVERELTGFDLSTNKVNLTHRNMPGLTGEGLVVSLKENRPDTLDMDLRGRYVYSPAASKDMQTHATTMATIIAGGGNTYYTGKGVAWGASLSSSDFANLLPDNISELQRLNVSVQNHSYGVGIENYYGADAAAYDAQAFQNSALLHIFSAGNLGTQASAAGNYTGIAAYANLSGSFKMAKNDLTVGSIDSFGTVPALSSRGPAYDGRLKPELVALGEDGSSGAAAIVSGVALLIQDAWKQRNNILPSSALVKAVLVNSANDVERRGIDFVSGYGSVNAYRALQTVVLDRIITGTVQQGQINRHSISIPANARNLKISLCWTDPPAQANTYKALVNDLDLELYRPLSNESWKPWVLNSNANIDSLQLLPVRRRDSVNTIEQVSIDDPQAGNYELRVGGFAMSGAQPYAIAWQYDTLEHFMLSYPVKGDHLFAGQTHAIRWETTLTGNATLQYRINSGSWRTVSATVALDKNYFRWQTPDTLGALQLRMLINNREWLSDTVSLSSTLSVNTGFNCADSFLVYWQRAAVDSYHVYRLGPKYLELFKTVADTALLQYKTGNPYQVFTVAPLLPFRIEGARSYAFDYTQQQVGCYISGFIADPAGDASANLSLQLGTTYNVSKVVFEKLSPTGFRPVHAFTPVSSRQVLGTELAGKGLNTYRARVELSSGTVYYTKPEQVYIFAGQRYYVFPNPVRPGMPLQLLAEDPDELVFAVYDLYGRTVLKYPVTGFLSTIKLPLLQKGVYYYSILKAGMKQESHSFIVSE